MKLRLEVLDVPTDGRKHIRTLIVRKYDKALTQPLVLDTFAD